MISTLYNDDGIISATGDSEIQKKRELEIITISNNPKGWVDVVDRLKCKLCGSDVLILLW